MPYKKGETSGDKNTRWNGGVKTHAHGYRLIACPNHPYKDKQGYVREHRLVMEAVMGRFLVPGEEVHHLDGNKQNNDPKNLIYCATKQEHLMKYHKEGGKKTWFKKGQISLNKNGKEIPCTICGEMIYVPKAKLTTRKVCTKKGCRTLSVSRAMKAYRATLLQ